MDSILTIKELSVWYKVFGGYLRVVDSINLNVAPGEKVGLIGETGCGKTTTMKAVMRLLPNNAYIPQGKVVFKEMDILNMNRRGVKSYRNEGIAMIFQDPTASLNPVFTIGTQISAVISSSKQNDFTKDEIFGESINILKKVALPDPDRILKNYPFQLSGGMRQRICIALAMSTARTLLIADEPTTSLDVTIQAQILDLITKLVREEKTSLILITHSLGVAREITDRVYVMYAGTIIEASKTDQLYEKPLHPYTQGLLISVPKLTGGGFADGIPGRIPDYLHPPSGCRFRPRCSRAMDICGKEKPPLFEVDKDHRAACFLYKDQGIIKT